MEHYRDISRPKKIQSIMDMKFPEDKETMQSFLGLINFLHRYSKNLARFCTPLRELTHKNGHYTVTEEHRSAFREIKAEFAQKIVLPYFHTEKKCVLQVDASKKGFGAVLMQDGNPVYYASRTLSKAEQNYQNLERECAWQQYGVWKSSITFFMEGISCCKQIRSL